jgi:hypothetical protein
MSPRRRFVWYQRFGLHYSTESRTGHRHNVAGSTPVTNSTLLARVHATYSNCRSSPMGRAVRAVPALALPRRVRRASPTRLPRSRASRRRLPLPLPWGKPESRPCMVESREISTPSPNHLVGYADEPPRGVCLTPSTPSPIQDIDKTHSPSASAPASIFYDWPGCSGILTLARPRRVRGVTLTRLPDFVRCAFLSQTGSNSAGEHTRIERHFTREVATFNRLSEYRKFMPRGASACVEVVME